MSLALATKGVISVGGTGEVIYVLDLSVEVEVDDLEVSVALEDQSGGSFMSNILEIQQGEGKWIKFTVTRSNVALSLTSATLFFGVKKAIGNAEYVYKVEDTDWDKTEAADGIVRVNLPALQTKQMSIGRYDAQARFILTADTDVDKTQKLTIQIRPAVIPD